MNNRKAGYLVLMLVLGVVMVPGAGAQDGVRMLPARDANFSYNWVQGGFESGRVENPRGSIDSVFVEGARGLDEHLFLLGGLTLFDGKVRHGPGSDRPEFDGYRLQGGLGFNTRLDRGLDLVLSGQVARVYADFDEGGSDAKHGVLMRGGVRYQASQELELSGGAFFESIDRSEIGLYGEGLYRITDPLDLGVRIAVGDDVGTVGLVLRYGF